MAHHISPQRTITLGAAMATLGLLLATTTCLAPQAVAATAGYQYSNPYAQLEHTLNADVPNLLGTTPSGYISVPAVADVDDNTSADPSTEIDDIPVLMAAIQSPEALTKTGSADAPTFDMRRPTPINLTKGRSKIIKFAQPLQRVSIADPQLADIIPLEPEQLMVNGLQRGVTSLIVWDEFGREGIFDLNINNDTSELRNAINEIAPDEDIQLRITDDSFVVSGQASSSVILDEIRQLAGAYGYRDENFVDLTETPIPQVVLSVKIVEMGRSTARDIKTSFFTDAGNSFSLTRLANNLEGGDSTFFRSQARPVSQFSSAGAISRATNGIIPARPLSVTQQASNLGGITGSLLGFNNTPVGFSWDILENQGKLSTLAEPKLVSTHGRQASFLAGGEFPFVSGINFNGSPILEFKEYGVILNFTPWVNVRTGMIELNIAPEVSSLDSSNCVVIATGNVCGLIKRATETTVQLQDGESLMISGILSKREEENFAKVPFIADIPIIGNLFKNPSTSKQDTELIVVVQPKIIQTQGAFRTASRR